MKKELTTWKICVCVNQWVNLFQIHLTGSLLINVAYERTNKELFLIKMMHKSLWRHCSERVWDLHYKSAAKSSINVLKKDLYNQPISCCCGNWGKSGITSSAFIKSLTLLMKTKRTNLQKGPPAPRSCSEQCCWSRGQTCSRDSGRPALGPGYSLDNKDKVQRSADGALQSMLLTASPDLNLTPSP